MNKKILFVSLSLLIQTSLAIPALAAGAEFPGKGNEKDWVKAAHIYDNALSMRKRGKIDEAIKLYEEAIQIYPYDADFYYNLAIHYSRDKHDYAKADQLLNKAIELKPDGYLLHWQQAANYLRQDKVVDAKNCLVSAAKLQKTPAQQTEYDSVMAQIDERLKNDHQ